MDENARDLYDFVYLPQEPTVFLVESADVCFGVVPMSLFFCLALHEEVHFS